VNNAELLPQVPHLVAHPPERGDVTVHDRLEVVVQFLHGVLDVPDLLLDETLVRESMEDVEAILELLHRHSSHSLEVSTLLVAYLL